MKEFYDQSRTAFLHWKSAGSPRQGSIAEIMRRKSAQFERVLRQTKKREDEIRAEIIATKYNSGDPRELWRELNSVYTRQAYSSHAN